MIILMSTRRTKIFVFVSDFKKRIKFHGILMEKLPSERVENFSIFDNNDEGIKGFESFSSHEYLREFSSKDRGKDFSWKVYER
jgi:hypothetical protein